MVAITEQYTSHLKAKTDEADDVIINLKPEYTALQDRMNQSTALISDARQQIVEIGDTCGSQKEVFATLKKTVESLQEELQGRMEEMTGLSDEVTILVNANEGQAKEIERYSNNITIFTS